MTDEKQTQEQADEEMINQGFQELLDSYLATKHRKKVEIITKAFNFAKQAHKGVKRRSGEPYIMHPIAVAKIVCTEIGLGSTSICSALLHDVVEDTDYTVEDIENAAKVSLNIVVRKEGLKAAKYMKEKYNIPYVTIKVITITFKYSNKILFLLCIASSILSPEVIITLFVVQSSNYVILR